MPAYALTLQVIAKFNLLRINEMLYLGDRYHQLLKSYLSKPKSSSPKSHAWVGLRLRNHTQYFSTRGCANDFSTRRSARSLSTSAQCPI
ncbi:MAG: hypothetical protein V7L00_17440 [Nostoc sp.]